VFDGAKHPMKAKTHMKRRDDKLKAQSYLDSFYQRGNNCDTILTDDEFTKAEQCRKIIASPNNEILSLILSWFKSNDAKYTCAPFKAEWQCIYMERLNQVNAVMSKDGDAIIIGVHKLYYNIDFNDHSFKEYDKINDKINLSNNSLFLYEDN